MKAIAIGAVVAASFVVPAQADTVEDLLGYCEMSSPKFAYCYGLIQGMYYPMFVNGSFVREGLVEGKAHILATCYENGPPSIPAQINAFRKWAADHPDAWGDTDYVGATMALTEIYPCYQTEE